MFQSIVFNFIKYNSRSAHCEVPSPLPIKESRTEDAPPSQTPPQPAFKDRRKEGWAALLLPLLLHPSLGPVPVHPAGPRGGRVGCGAGTVPPILPLKAGGPEGCGAGW